MCQGSRKRRYTVYPRNKEIAIYEFSLYCKFSAAPTAVLGEQMIFAFNEVLLITKFVSCPEGFVMKSVYCIIISFPVFSCMRHSFLLLRGAR